MSQRARVCFVSLILLVGCIVAIANLRKKQQMRREKDNLVHLDSDTNLVLTLEEEEQPNENQELRESDALERHSVLLVHPKKDPDELESGADALGTIEEGAGFDAYSRETSDTISEDEKFPPLDSQPQPKSGPLGNTTGSSSFDDLAKTQLSDPWPDNEPQVVPLQPRKLQRTSAFSLRPPSDLAATRIWEEPQSSPRIAGEPLVPLSKEQRAQSIFVGSPLSPSPRKAVSGPSGPELSGLDGLTERRSIQQENQSAWHRIANGDTLEKLAKQYYGDPGKAIMIFEANRQNLFNPSILPLGLELRIPFGR